MYLYYAIISQKGIFRKSHTYHDRLSMVRKMINESKASIVAVLCRDRRGPAAIEKTAVITMAQSEMQPLILAEATYSAKTQRLNVVFLLPAVIRKM